MESITQVLPVLGPNIAVELEGSILTLRIDLSRTIAPSKSGKSVLVASTNGSATLPDGTKVGLNVYRPITGSSPTT